MVCYLIYSDLPSNYTKLEKNFGRFMKRSLVRVEFELSPLHTIVYDATGTSNTFFVKQYLKLYQIQEQDKKDIVEQDNKDIVEQDNKDMVEQDNKDMMEQKQ